MIVGIDLGTTNTSICYYKNGHPFFIKDQNNHNISSIIGITKFGNVFGNQSKALKDNNVFISNIKRLIGYKYDELPLSYYEQFAYKIININNEIKIELNDNTYSPDELLTYFLNYLKTLINKEIFEEYKVIVTVPAYFTIKQKEIVNMCISNAGLNCLKLINEPTAAAISYGSFINFKTEDKILIFDLGGGTLDLSILNIENEDGEFLYEVIGTYGNNKCGGSDLTFMLIDFIKMKYDKFFFLFY
jgi:molecular chaperone DnaK (HSP70)